ncbi:MAG: ribosome biogenesis GTP-binding protein YihA/YsxC, partial [Mucinivorans sp.]
MNEINKARFLCSSEKLSQCPPAVLDGKMVAELAFIGRSNVGKSSLINCLTANSSLAKVSGTPGKTKLINHFVVDEGWLLVDLPGYGYAKASKTMREAFSALITAYITKREELYCLFVLIDIRLEPQKIDREFMEMLASNGVPFVLVFTKADKLSAAQRARAIQAYKKALEDDWEDFPEYFITSAANSLGREELLQYIFNL